MQDDNWFDKLPESTEKTIISISFNSRADKEKCIQDPEFMEVFKKMVELAHKNL